MLETTPDNTVALAVLEEVTRTRNASSSASSSSSSAFSSPSIHPRNAQPPVHPRRALTTITNTTQGNQIGKTPRRAPPAPLRTTSPRSLSGQTPPLELASSPEVRSSPRRASTSTTSPPPPSPSADVQELQAQVSYLRTKLFEANNPPVGGGGGGGGGASEVVSNLTEERGLLMESLGQQIEEIRVLKGVVEDRDTALRRAASVVEELRRKNIVLEEEHGSAVEAKRSAVARVAALENALREAASRHTTLANHCERKTQEVHDLTTELSEERNVQDRVMAALDGANEEIKMLKARPSSFSSSSSSSPDGSSLAKGLQEMQAQMQANNMLVLSRLDEMRDTFQGSYADRVCPSSVSVGTMEGRCYFSSEIHRQRSQSRSPGFRQHGHHDIPVGSSGIPLSSPCSTASSPPLRSQAPSGLPHHDVMEEIRGEIRGGGGGGAGGGVHGGVPLTPRELFDVEIEDDDEDDVVGNNLTLDSPFMP